MMASVSDNIRALTGVFTILLQIMSDERAAVTWLPDVDAFDRPCRILFAIAVISDEAPPQSNEAASVACLVHPQPCVIFSRYSQRCRSAGGTAPDLPRRETTFVLDPCVYRELHPC